MKIRSFVRHLTKKLSNCLCQNVHKTQIKREINRQNESNLKNVMKLLINKELVNKVDFLNEEKTKAFETKSQNNEKKSFKKNFNKKKCKHCVEEHKKKTADMFILKMLRIASFRNFSRTKLENQR